MTLTFNIAFTDKCFYLRTTNINSISSYAKDYDYQIIALTNKNAKLFKQGFNDGTDWYLEKINWFAIGI